MKKIGALRLWGCRGSIRTCGGRAGAQRSEANLPTRGGASKRNDYSKTRTGGCAYAAEKRGAAHRGGCKRWMHPDGCACSCAASRDEHSGWTGPAYRLRDLTSGRTPSYGEVVARPASQDAPWKFFPPAAMLNPRPVPPASAGCCVVSKHALFAARGEGPVHPTAADGASIMSGKNGKGSARRPGKPGAYGRGYERIQWGKKVTRPVTAAPQNLPAHPPRD